jgi:hypothetical protein
MIRTNLDPNGSNRFLISGQIPPHLDLILTLSEV